MEVKNRLKKQKPLALMEKKEEDLNLLYSNLPSGMEIGSHINNIDLSRFKVFKSKTLFEPEREDLIRWLSQKLCPYCMKRLYPQRDGKIYRCKSKQKDGFFIRTSVLNKFLL